MAEKGTVSKTKKRQSEKTNAKGGRKGPQRSHNPKPTDVLKPHQMAFHQASNLGVGSRQKALQARWERENRSRILQEQLEEAARLTELNQAKVRNNRRLIAASAAEHPSVTGLEPDSLASLYARELVWQYGRSPVNDKANWDPTVWAADQAIATFSDEDKRRHKAIGLGKTAAKTALKDAFALFHVSFELTTAEADIVEEELAAVG